MPLSEIIAVFQDNFEKTPTNEKGNKNMGRDAVKIQVEPTHNAYRNIDGINDIQVDNRMINSLLFFCPYIINSTNSIEKFTNS